MTLLDDLAAKTRRNKFVSPSNIEERPTIWESYPIGPPEPKSLACLLEKRAPYKMIKKAYEQDESKLTFELLATELGLCPFIDAGIPIRGHMKDFPKDVLEFLFVKLVESKSKKVGELLALITIFITGFCNRRPDLTIIPVSALAQLVPAGLRQLRDQQRTEDLERCLQIATYCHPEEGANSLTEKFRVVLSRHLTQYIEHLHQGCWTCNGTSRSRGPTSVLRVLIPGRNLRSFFLDATSMRPEHVDGIFQCLWQNNYHRITHFYYKSSPPNPENTTGAVALLNRIINEWHRGIAINNIQTFGMYFSRRAAIRQEVEAFYSLAMAMPHLANLELALPSTGFNILGRLLQECSTTLTSVKVAGHPEDQLHFLRHALDPILGITGLTCLVIQDDDGSPDNEVVTTEESYGNATMTLQRLYSLLEARPQMFQMTVDKPPLLRVNDESGQDELVEFHPLIGEIEFTCAMRRAKHRQPKYPFTETVVTTSDLYEFVKGVTTDEIIRPKKSWKPHKLAIITSVIFDNMRNSHDTWASIIPSLNV